MTERLKLKPSCLQWQKKNYKCRFEVSTIAVCSSAGLIACGSQSGIVELIREAKMTMCWRLDISLVSKQVGAKPSKLQCLEFSPDGECLIAGTHDGFYHIIHVPSGNVIISGKTNGSAIMQARWTRVSISEQPSPGNSVDGLNNDAIGELLSQEERAGISVDKLARLQSVESSEEKKRTEWRDEHIVQLYDRHIKHTVLTLVTDELTIWIIAAGVMVLTVVNVQDLADSNNLQTYVSNVYDAVYSSDMEGLLFAYTSQGRRPKCGEDGKFGFPTIPPNAENSSHTHIACVDLKIIESPMLWAIVGRFIKLTNSWAQLERIFDAVKKHWEGGSQTNIGVKKGLSILDTTNKDVTVHLGPCLVTTLLSGECGPRAHNQFSSEGSDSRFAQLREFAERTFTEVISMIRAELSMAARLTSFQAAQIVTDLERFAQQFKEEDPEKYLLPDCNEDVNVYPYGVLSNESVSGVQVTPNDKARLAIESELISATNKLFLKVEQMSHVSVVNLRNLSNLIRWLNTLPLLYKDTRLMTKSEIIARSKRCDIDELIKYVIYAFVRDPELKAFYESALEDVCGLLEKCEQEAKQKDKAKDDMETGESILPVATSKIDLLDVNETKSREVLLKLQALSQSYDQYSSKDGENPDGSFTRHKHDCVSSFFELELDEHAIELLERTWPWDSPHAKRIHDLVAFKKAGLKRCIGDVSNVVAKLEKVMQHFTHANLTWMYEVDSSMTHQGFDSLRMELITGAHAPSRLHLVGSFSNYVYSHLIKPEDKQESYQILAEWDVQTTIAELIRESPLQDEGNEQNIKPETIMNTEELGKLTGFCGGFPLNGSSNATIIVAKFDTPKGQVQRLILKQADASPELDMDDLSSSGLSLLEIRGWRGCLLAANKKTVNAFRLVDLPAHAVGSAPIPQSHKPTAVFLERKSFEITSSYA